MPKLLSHLDIDITLLTPLFCKKRHQGIKRIRDLVTKVTESPEQWHIYDEKRGDLTLESGVSPIPCVPLGRPWVGFKNIQDKITSFTLLKVKLDSYQKIQVTKYKAIHGKHQQRLPGYRQRRIQEKGINHFQPL